MQQEARGATSPASRAAGPPRGQHPGPTGGSRQTASRSGSAASTRSTPSRCTSSPARCSASSARTAPARPRCSTSSAASSRPTRAHCAGGASELKGLKPHQLPGLGIARTLQGVGLFPRMTVLENVMAGATARAKAGFVARCSACRAATRTRRGCATRAMADAGRARRRAVRRSLPGEPALPGAEARRAGAGAGRRARPAHARRAGRRPGPTTMDELGDTDPPPVRRGWP